MPGSFTRSPSFGGGRLSPAVGAQSPPPSRGRPSDGVDWDNAEWNLQVGPARTGALSSCSTNNSILQCLTNQL